MRKVQAKTERQNRVDHASVVVILTINPELLHASAPPATSKAPRRYCARAAALATEGLASSAWATGGINLGLDDGGCRFLSAILAQIARPPSATQPLWEPGAKMALLRRQPQFCDHPT